MKQRDTETSEEFEARIGEHTRRAILEATNRAHLMALIKDQVLVQVALIVGDLNRRIEHLEEAIMAAGGATGAHLRIRLE